jgi:hypothetical protein
MTSVRALTDMDPTTYGRTYAVGPLIAGVLHRGIEFPIVGPMENLFWGFVYGLGFEAAFALGLLDGFATGANQLPTVVPGLIWPALVSFGLFYLGRRIWSRGSRALRIGATVTFVASMLAVVPVSWLREPPFDQIPLYVSTTRALF